MVQQTRTQPFTPVVSDDPSVDEGSPSGGNLVDQQVIKDPGTPTRSEIFQTMDAAISARQEEERRQPVVDPVDSMTDRQRFIADAERVQRAEDGLDDGGTRRFPSVPTEREATDAEKETISDAIDKATDLVGDPSTATEAQQAAIRERLIQNFNDPTQVISDLGVEQTFTPLQLANNELLDPTKFQARETAGAEAGQISVTEAEAAPDVKVQDFETETIDLNTLKRSVDELAKAEPMQAAQVSEEMNKLLEGMEEGNIPLWARPAVTKVEQALASRGISASSIGRDSLFNAIIGAALPIAQGDAQLKQDANKTNYNAKVQAILSDVQMEFAAKQFNASSINQKNQFMTQLKAQVDSQNAARKDAVSQFNANASNQASIANAQMATQVSLANAQMAQQREQFNTQMSAQIEQSNVQWRRQINTVNNAGINAVNQANVQNAFNLSNQAQAALWQEMRDEAHWAFQASEQEKDRQHQLEATILANEQLAAQVGAAEDEGSVTNQLFRQVMQGATKKLTDVIGDVFNLD